MSGKVFFGLFSIAGTTLAAGYYYRPLPHHVKKDEKTDDPPKIPLRTNHSFLSPNLFSDQAHEPLPWVLEFSRRVAVLTLGSLVRFIMLQGGQITIQQDKNYMNFLSKVKSREPNQALLTVSNHRSMVDDPGVVSALLPYWMNIQPKYLRYSLCAQEYCYNEKLGPFIHGLIALTKVLPIHRGGGIDQKLFLDFAHLFAHGEWCHLFPEAGIWQLDTLGGRSNGKESEIGKLKWGVGKLIAHAPKRPVVIAFYFSGSEKILPQDPQTKDLLSPIPKLNHNIQICFSQEIVFNDLIQEHEKKYGNLWKYSTNSDLETWKSKPQDLELYSKIAKRIEDVLTQLNEEYNRKNNK